jgi:hypothetical protein
MKHIDPGIPTLAVALSNHMNTDELKALARLTKGPAPQRKPDLARHILEYLDGDRLRMLWQSLDDLQKAAVAEVVHSMDTVFPADRFRAKYGTLPNFETARGDRTRDTRPTPLRFFFFFFGRVQQGGVMPDDLKERLRAFVPPPVEAEVESVEQLAGVYDRPFEYWNAGTKQREHRTESVPLSVRERERSAQRELLSVLRLVDAGKVAVGEKTRRASGATIDRVTAVLDGGDYYPFEPPKNSWDDENAGPIRAFAWPLLIQAGGLAQISGSKLQLTKAGRTALAEPAAKTLKTLWEKWTGTTLFDELARIECVKGQTGKGKHGLTAAWTRREAIDGALARCPAQRWIAADEMLRFVRASEDDFAVARDPWYLYIEELQYGSLGYEGGAAILDERYLLCLLFEYAATLGLIDVAFIPPAGARRNYGHLWGTDDLPFFSRYDGFIFFRITALGTYCLGTSKTYEQARVEVKPVLRVLPNLEIVAIGADLDQGDRLALDAYAVRVSELEWRLDARKLLSAVEEGRSIDETREFLSTHSGAPLPDTVLQLLDDVGERCARAHDRGPARLIECDDRDLAALIANDARAGKHCMRAGERHLVVAAASEAAFRRALRAIGYLLAAPTPHGAKGRRTKAPQAPSEPADEA